MKFRSSLATAKKPLILALSGALLLVFYFGAAKHFNFWPLQSSSQTSSIISHAKTADPSPKNNNPSTKEDVKASIDEGKTSEQVPVSPSMRASITTLEESDQQVHFSAEITGVTGAGTCVVTFSNPYDRPVTQQFSATLTGTTATCGPTTISANEFSYLGEWQVELHYYVGPQQATAESSLVIQ